MLAYFYTTTTFTVGGFIHHREFEQFLLYFLLTNELLLSHCRLHLHYKMRSLELDTRIAHQEQVIF